MQTLQDNELFQTGYLVDGLWKTLDTTFDVLNPATGETIAKVAKAGKQQTEEAIAAASKAFPAWRAKTAKERSAILYRWYELIIENKTWLGRLMTTEQGKPLKEAEGEVEYAASFIQWFAEQAKRANGEIIPPIKPGSRILATREPIGVVAAITPWNFPMAMLTRKLGPALAAGCTGVIKPANNTPLSAFALLTLAKKAGVPDGVLNAVAGNTPEISDAIMASHEVRKISFTGSTAVGKTLVRNAGQVCVSVNRFYIQERVYDEFTRKLADAVQALKVGNGLDDGVMVGPLIESSAVDKVREHVEDAVAKGAKVLAGGKAHALGGNFWQPTVLGECSDGMKLASEETFGPVAACFRFTHEEEVIQRANNTPFGLAAYFYTQNLQRVFRVSQAIESGMIGINECAVSTELGPFGGVKESGLGREGSVLGLDEFLEVKTLHIGGL
ncbi:NAD-dependent succinate-semialdehyde dehydrogenase [Citrobacter farmeri]|nr:NAD-dependent succinate-semialdehyde dehydrogenase [Citrobacter farmeri]